MTSGGKRYPAKADLGAGRTGGCRRDLIARVSLMPTPAANATVPLDVVHYPLTDYQRPSDASMSRIADEYDRLPKPVLIFCSAAIDRTTPVAAFIVRLERPAGGAASS